MYNVELCWLMCLHLLSFFCSLVKERHYVGRGMYERSSDFIKYALDLVFFLIFKFVIEVVVKARLLPWNCWYINSFKYWRVKNCACFVINFSCWSCIVALIRCCASFPRYLLLWLVILSAKFAFAYFLQVSDTYINSALLFVDTCGIRKICSCAVWRWRYIYWWAHMLLCFDCCIFVVCRLGHWWALPGIL